MQGRFRLRIALAVAVSAGALAALNAQAPSVSPVTDAILQDPPAESWLMWRRTLNGWGFSPLDEIDRTNVGELQMVWSRGPWAGAAAGDATRARRRALHAEPARHHRGDRRRDR